MRDGVAGIIGGNVGVHVQIPLQDIERQIDRILIDLVNPRLGCRR